MRTWREWDGSSAWINQGQGGKAGGQRCGRYRGGGEEDAEEVDHHEGHALQREDQRHRRIARALQEAGRRTGRRRRRTGRQVSSYGDKGGGVGASFERLLKGFSGSDCSIRRDPWLVELVLEDGLCTMDNLA